MSQKLEGLWLGGEISREAAEFVLNSVELALHARCRLSHKAHAELMDFTNAVRAQIQKLPKPKPVCDLI